MNQATITYDGTEWQEIVMVWLRLRHHGQLEELPDQHVGDFGIEAFSRNGIVYQCYAPEDPLQSQDLYANQRDKLTRDIGKFIRNSTNLARLFGAMKIKEYWFVTPEHKSALLTQHAEKKRQEVLAAGLSYVDPTFFITIKTADEFAGEQVLASSQFLSTIAIEAPVDDGDVDGWAGSETELAKRLEAKTSRLLRITDTQAIAEYRDVVIRFYLASGNILDKLRSDAPILWESVERCRRHREKFITSECLDSPDSPKATLKDLQEQLRQDLQKLASGLHPHTIEDLAKGIICDWMVSCPLDFPEDGNAGSV